jgi:hypothetical protein
LQKGDEKYMTGTNIGISIPQAIGDALFGGSATTGGIFISVIVLVAVLIPIMIWLNKKNNIPPQLYLILVIVIMGMETAIGWLDQWIFVTIIFVVVASFSAYFFYGHQNSPIR